MRRRRGLLWSRRLSRRARLASMEAAQAGAASGLNSMQCSVRCTSGALLSHLTVCAVSRSSWEPKRCNGSGPHIPKTVFGSATTASWVSLDRVAYSLPSDIVLAAVDQVCVHHVTVRPLCRPSQCSPSVATAESRGRCRTSVQGTYVHRPRRSRRTPQTVASCSVWLHTRSSERTRLAACFSALYKLGRPCRDEDDA